MGRDTRNRVSRDRDSDRILRSSTPCQSRSVGGSKESVIRSNRCAASSDEPCFIAKRWPSGSNDGRPFSNDGAPGSNRWRSSSSDWQPRSRRCRSDSNDCVSPSNRCRSVPNDSRCARESRRIDRTKCRMHEGRRCIDEDARRIGSSPRSTRSHRRRILRPGWSLASNSVSIHQSWPRIRRDSDASSSCCATVNRESRVAS